MSEPVNVFGLGSGEIVETFDITVHHYHRSLLDSFSYQFVGASTLSVGNDFFDFCLWRQVCRHSFDGVHGGDESEMFWLSLSSSSISINDPEFKCFF